MAVALDKTLAEHVDDAVRRIMSAEHSDNGSFVRLPLTYPSGAGVVVHVAAQQDRCHLTDLGFGFQEAEMIGAGDLYHAQAVVIANEAGIGYDGNAVFAVEVARERLAGALTVLANCSSRAAAQAALRLSEQKDRKSDEQLYQRLVAIFRKESVARGVKVVGASNHTWRVSNLVTLPSGGRAAFEAVSSHHVSVASTAVKFHDLARLDPPPSRVSVVRDPASFGDLLGVLSQASAVIQLTASKESYQTYARAA